MSEIRYITNPSEITFDDGWSAKDSFKSKNCVVEYANRTYKIETKQVLKYSTLERFFRGIIGALLTVFSLGILYYKSKTIQKLFTKETKASRLFAIVQDMPARPMPSKASFFDSHASEWSFWDSFVSEYNAAINSKSEKWGKVQGLLFLHDELLGAKGEIANLQSRVQDDTLAFQQKKVEDSACFEQSLGELEKLKANIEKLQDKLQQALSVIRGKLQQEDVQVEVRGIENVGNSCYINAALQPLLAIKHLEALVPQTVKPTPRETLRERQRILDAFCDFLHSWKSGHPSGELGQKVALLRREIFQAGLLQGGFVEKNEEWSYQDAGSFFELLLYVLGRGFDHEITKIPFLADGTKLESCKASESTPAGVFFLKTAGESIQEKVHGYLEPQRKTFEEEGWKITHPETQEELAVYDYEEIEKIRGNPPEMLVVRTDSHIIKERDFEINMAPLFKSRHRELAYSLVGFSQNHGQYHWTAVAKDEKDNSWNACNDAIVNKVSLDAREFTYPANYLVYKKLTKK